MHEFLAPLPIPEGAALDSLRARSLYENENRKTEKPVIDYDTIGKTANGVDIDSVNQNANSVFRYNQCKRKIIITLNTL